MAGTKTPSQPKKKREKHGKAAFQRRLASSSPNEQKALLKSKEGIAFLSSKTCWRMLQKLEREELRIQRIACSSAAAAAWGHGEQLLAELFVGAVEVDRLMALPNAGGRRFRAAPGIAISIAFESFGSEGGSEKEPLFHPRRRRLVPAVAQMYEDYFACMSHDYAKFLREFEHDAGEPKRAGSVTPSSMMSYHDLASISHRLDHSPEYRRRAKAKRQAADGDSLIREIDLADSLGMSVMGLRQHHDTLGLPPPIEKCIKGDGRCRRRFYDAFAVASWWLKSHGVNPETLEDTSVETGVPSE